MPLPKHIANYTPPDKPTFVDVFKGRDDENFLRKNLIMLKHTSFITFWTTAADVICISDPTTITAGAMRAMYWGVPIIGGGITYISAVTMLSSLRKKDDRVNHYLAGHAVGAVCGAARKSVFFGLTTGVIFGIVGLAYKDSVIEGYEVFPGIDMTKRAIGHPYTHLWDCTVTKKTDARRGWWARSQEEADQLMRDTDTDINNVTLIAN